MDETNDPPPNYDDAAEESDGTLDNVTTSVITTTTTTTRVQRARSARPSAASASRRPTRSKSIESFQSNRTSDPYLDSLLARSVAALELSNALLQSTMATKSTLSSVLASEEELERQERAFEQRLLESNGIGLAEERKMAWMKEMENIVRDVESLFDIPNSTSNTPASTLGRRTGIDAASASAPRLVLGDAATHIRSPPPRALTQYVSISGAGARAPGFAAESTADKNSIFLPSTTGMRSSAHKEALSGDVGIGRVRRSSLSRGHSAQASTSSSSSLRPLPPPTHPEALPLSPQELLQLQTSNETASTSPREDPYKYLRGLRTHAATASASSTVSKGSLSDTPIRPVLSPRQPRISKSRDGRLQHAMSPTTASFTAFPRGLEEGHARTPSNASGSTHSSRSSNKYIPSIQLPLSFPTLRRSPNPNLRSPTSPTQSMHSNASSEAAPIDFYSPSLASIPDHHEEDLLIPTSSSLDDRGRSPAVVTSFTPARGRAILSSRFRTADTLRKILDTSPSPHPTATTPIDIQTPTSSTSAASYNTARKNTDASSKTIRKSSSRKMLDASSVPLPASLTYEPHTHIGGLGSSSSISSTHSNSIYNARTHSAMSSSSDLPSNASAASDVPQLSADRKRSSVTLRKPAPRFLPRTPAGGLAGISVSGATAHAPVMHAHLVQDPEDVPLSDPTSPLHDPSLKADLSSPRISDSGSMSPGLYSPPERRRTTSLSASVSSIISQKRALENTKSNKGGSRLKGSPAWRAARKLPLDGPLPSPVPSPSPSVHGMPTLPVKEGEGSAGSSRRTSWIGTSLLGLKLPGSTSSLTANGSGSATRVSFAKEPVRYSEERESCTFDEREEEEHHEDGEADADADGGEGGLTIRPSDSRLRRTKSWDGSIRSGTSSRGRRVPSRSGRSKKKEEEKKGGWLEWFLAAAAASSTTPGPGPGPFGSMGREEMFDRGRDEWM